MAYLEGLMTKFLKEMSDQKSSSGMNTPKETLSLTRQESELLYQVALYTALFALAWIVPGRLFNQGLRG